MRRDKNIRRRNHQEGIIITLVAVCMLGFIGAMAALSIDVVTLYTARSEAQLVADAAALAGARVLANSGATSDPTGTLLASLEASSGFATIVATQVAQSSTVGGRYLIPGGKCPGQEICVSFYPAAGVPSTNPHITVAVQRTDLPTFFARIWGTTQVTVGASATAEAYNPSNTSTLTTNSNPAVAPLCVKPWLLPNIDPSGKSTSPNGYIFDPMSGAIDTTGLLGWSSVYPGNGSPMILNPNCSSAPGTCIPSSNTAWNYYPGDQSSFPAPPATSLATCSQMASPTPYQESIAGCVQTPIYCNSQATSPSQVINIDITTSENWNTDTADAVNCLTHATATGGADTVTSPATPPPSTPFEFVAGTNNPITGLAGNNVMVSDSLVTVPVFDNGPGVGALSINNQIVGFVQLFLNPDGKQANDSGPPFPPPGTNGSINATVINLVGCGTSATGTAIQGNGASPVAVRLISPP